MVKPHSRRVKEHSIRMTSLRGLCFDIPGNIDDFTSEAKAVGSKRVEARPISLLSGYTFAESVS